MANSNKNRKVQGPSSSKGKGPGESDAGERTSTARKSTAKKSTSPSSATKANGSTPAAKKSAESTPATKAGGKGGAVKVGDKRNTGPKAKPKKAAPSSKAMADARKAASGRGGQMWLWVLAAVVVIALGVAGVFAVINRTEEANALPEGFPQGEVVDGALVYGEEAAPAKVEYWVDLLCPFCRQFEQGAAETIEKAVAAGDAQLTVHIIGLLDPQTDPPGYSSRAGSAVLCVAGEGKSYQLMKTLYEEQPPEGGSGLSVDEIAEYAGDVGASDEAIKCITDEANTEAIAANSEQFEANGFQGTPTVLVNGQPVESPEALGPAIEQAQSAPAPEQAPASGEATDPAGTTG